MKLINEKTINYYLLIILLSILPLISIFITPKLYHSHDGLVHLPRIAAYFKALKDGEIPVRWAGYLNYGYGMPLFNFIYPLPYFISSFFVLLGFGLVNAFKISISLSYLLSGIFMFAFAKEFFSDNKKAFLIAIFYQFAPFRLVELLIRGSFGEVYAYAFLPLVLFAVVRYNKYQRFRNLVFISFSTLLLILSHNAISLVFFAITAGFIFLFTKKQVMFKCLSGLILGLLLTVFYWLPAIFEHKYTYGDLFMKNLYLQHFPQIQNFFIPNLFHNPNLETMNVPVQFGLFHVLAIILSIIVILTKKISGLTSEVSKKFLFINLSLIVITIFVMQKSSLFIWQHSAILRQFQFSWRFLAVDTFAASMLTVSFFSFSFFRKKCVYILLILITVLSTAYYWKPPLGYDSINENYYWNFPLTTTYFGETDVIWSAGPAKSYPKNRIEFISGSGVIKNLTQSSSNQSFTVNANSESQLVDKTEYFPGWRVYINGKPVQVQFQDQNWRGLMTFFVPKGKSDIKVVFGETPLRLFSDIFSICSLVLLVFLEIFLHKKISKIK